MNKKPSSARGLEFSTLADRIRSARRKASISQSELARRIGVSASAVAQWEHPSGTQPTLQSLVRIFEITGVSIDWLVTGKASSSGNVSLGNDDVPAVSLEFFAHCLQEENLLRVFREIPTKCRSLLLDVAEELSLPRTFDSR
ncbi:MAG TPA: helix-turn-helix transcriptional regulator [Dokdonella sp.]|uniref:helix-turn-helix domain-containing protein n=1 Tax=Dokdonella sp. TaxID=2291710 RepID=UPI002D7ED102|nr:helix-turn-helix transcriptional regulator [Dokdonella sp.]HET9034087.1 helix-turn-helix transcriptional regulator [Dokdonella sp.]